ncbi:uncharacterized protein LOC114727097 [Neltuma alba]|uniref:uncharacterized protein LOC114727097 n=1 Tax=Neltuma alba TaxID=207710 RepID=UPI0010A56091|nr:uncharacterized protein LOC114727097 [Prosopis alba]
MEQESNKKTLFSCAMKGGWGKVIEMYKHDATLHNARITRSGQTALHIAVSDGKEDVVKKMVHAMSLTQPNQGELIKALRTPNNRKITALHVAAVMGNARMCHIIATVEPTLVDDRNAEGETPLFLAALHGRTQAFLCLHCIRNPDITTPPFCGTCRRYDGDTILHAAINGDFFDLAFQIVHLYKELTNWVNEEGLSPLHLLASKPTAFRSGSRLGRIETIIYHCIYVEKLKTIENVGDEYRKAVEDSDSHVCPDNYKTLWDACRLIKNSVTVVLAHHVEADAEDPGVLGGSPVVNERQENPLFPDNYETGLHWIKFFYLIILTIFGKGSEGLMAIYRKKQTHTWSVQIVEQLLHYASLYVYEDDGRKPQVDEGYNTNSLEDDTTAASIKPRSTENKGNDEQNPKRRTMETPILLAAAKSGVMEMIEKIVELFPLAIHDVNEDKKNIVLLAVEHRQRQVYEFLLKKNIYKESLFYQVDEDGNSVLHLAATLGDSRPWVITGEALQMQLEYKWYEFVKKSLPAGFTRLYNNRNETPDEVFNRTHGDLVKSGGEWLRKTSKSCSFVATIIVTVAFATATTVPGGVAQDSGYPTLENETAFNVFAASSLVALCCSVMAVVTFLSLLTSRFQEQDFYRDLPMQLLTGVTLLLMSIVSMLVSFCAGHFFVLKHQLHNAAFTLYAVISLLVIFYVLSKFPLHFDFLRFTFVPVPQRTKRATN